MNCSVYKECSTDLLKIFFKNIEITSKFPNSQEGYPNIVIALQLVRSVIPALKTVTATNQD